MTDKNTQTELPVLPYNGSSGSSGSDTSLRRAENLDNSGQTLTNQQEARRLLRLRGTVGLTGLELTELLRQKFGKCGNTTGNSVLSVLHLEGEITKVKEERKSHQVYVLPEYVNGREEVPHRPHGRTKVDITALLTKMDELEAEAASRAGGDEDGPFQPERVGLWTYEIRELLGLS